jgi:PKD repeat protein
LQASTTIAFSVQASDPDNDPLTFAWTFGDGGTSTGPAPTHIYQTSGTFTTAVAVSDGHVTVTNQTTVSVVGLTGTWGPSCAGGCPTESGLYFTLAQSGSTITGSYFSFLASVDCCAAAFALSGSVNMASPHVTVEATYAPPRLPTCWFLEPNADVSVLSGVLGSCNNPIAPSQAFARTNVIPHPSQ